MGRLFGTDGVRGKSGAYPLDVQTIRRLGAALTRALREADGSARFLAGRDTRESGSWIERELAAGIRSQQGTLTSAGVIPTPAIAYLTPRMGFTAGVVISASHNPFEDNGIKVFSGKGEKFTERLEAEVEAIVADTSWGPAEAGGGDPDVDVASGSSRTVVEQIDYRSEYIAHLLRILQPDARNTSVRIVVDCGNGATTTVAPRLFTELGFDARCSG
jgi:phosphoglucosamine mutase